MKHFLIFLMLVLTVGCGLKPAPLMQNEVTQKGNDLFESVQVSERDTYVVRSLKKELLAGETNSVQYRWVSAELTDLDETPRLFKVEYGMPDMPEMGTFESSPSYSKGLLSVDLDIVHGGLWEVKITVQESGKPEDSVVFSYQVAE